MGGKKYLVFGAFFLFFFFIIAGVIFWARRSNLGSEDPQVKINDQTIWVEVADTAEKRSRGLSGRESLPENQGMLFVFPEAANHSFWMNQMKFDLDFVFINGERVVAVVENVPFPKAGESPEVIDVQKESDKVLEIKAGMISRWGIEVGNRVEELRN